ncbi:MAG: hypothetical protein ACRCXC_07635 [Legionella sp.]
MLLNSLRRNTFGIIGTLALSRSVFAAGTAVPSVEIDNGLCLPKADCLLGFTITGTMLDKTGALCTTLTVAAASSSTYIPTGTCLTNRGVAVITVAPVQFGTHTVYGSKAVKLTATAGTNILADIKVAGTTDPVLDSTNAFIVDTAGDLSITETDAFAPGQ